MKKNVIPAIIAMAILATTVAMVSCKKEDVSASIEPEKNKKEAFVCPQIDDMIVYLKEFRKKLKDDKSNEVMGVDEAAWHLACLANIDFCKVNVEYNDVRFDTLEMKVDASQGVILMSDLNMAYSKICDKISQFKKGFTLDGQNLYYINIHMDSDGNARIAVMSSFNTTTKYLGNHAWYFEDEFVACEVCDEYYTADSTYIWNTTAARELQRVLNLFEHHENHVGPVFSNISYIPSRNHTFNYTNTYDTYGSDFYDNSRVLVYKRHNNELMNNYALSMYDWCYCLDSYLGLGYDYVDNTLYPNEHPVCWKVTANSIPANLSWKYHYHDLYVEYGRLVTIIGPPAPTAN